MSTVAARSDGPRANPGPLPSYAARIVLLGLTDSGKSALLGALARSAEFQERAMGGRLTESTPGLRTLRQTVYDNRTMPSAHDITAYPVRFDSFADGRTNAPTTTNFVLIDPDGRRASELLGSLNGVPTRTIPGSLSDHVANADAVLLVIDASSPDAWIDAGFAECLTFLRKFRRRRGQETDIAGLPVFLVLTKCDLLARPGDTAAIWAERMEARKEEAAQRFAEFLQEQKEPGFGSIAFTPVATAIRQPALSNSPARNDEPVGVADLFHQVTTQARDYFQRRSFSNERLRQLLLIIGTVAAFVIGFVSIVTLQRTIWKPAPLVAALEAYRADEGAPPIGHLAEPMNSKIEQLTVMARDPDFKRFSHADQAFITSRLDELRKYQDFAVRLKTMRLPTAARDLEELAATEKTLRDELALPAEFASTWKSSPAALRREELLQQIPLLRAAANKAVEAFEAQRRRLDALFVLADQGPNGQRLPWPQWNERVTKELAAVDQPPINPDQPIADWPTQLAESAPTFATPLSYLDMAREQQKVRTAADRLANLRDITRVIGLTPPTGPNLRLGNGFTVDQSLSLLNSLRTSYPRSSSWTLADVSDPVLAEVKQAARLCYEQMVPPARTALGQLPFEANANPLLLMTDRANDMPSFKAWNELARTALRLTGDESDPLADLARFAKQVEFPISINEVALRLPKDIPGGPFTPNGSWILYIQNSRGITFKQVLRLVEPIEIGKPFRFRTEDTKPLIYHPGDSLWAEVALRDNVGKDWVLGWVGFGSMNKRFQFDRLTRVPRLYRLEEKPEAGKFVLDTKLVTLPANGVPKVPDLVPDSIKNR